MRIRATLATGICAASAAITILSTSGPASADSTSYGPEWNPGPDYSNFEPGPDYTNFQPEPDQSPFEPGYAPGTADLLDNLTSSGLLGGLFGRR